jgi:hypothetical protein
MGIYAAEFNQTLPGANASEVFFQVAGPGTITASDGPFFAMRGNNFTRFANAKGAIEHRAGVITSPSGNDGAVLFTSPSSFIDFRTGSNLDSRMRITNAGESLFGTTTDAGDYRVQVAGGLYNTTSAYFNISSGETYIGTTSDAGAFRLQVNGVARASDGLATGAPAGGTAATWKLGIVVAGSYTAASNYLQVDVGGTLYYIGLVTPN